VGKAIVCGFRYRRHKKRIQCKLKTERIRVLFIVSEIAKWKEQFLYEAMNKSNDFYPIVGISAWNNQGENVVTAAEYEQIQEQAELFFDKMGDRHVRTVNIINGKWIYRDLSDFQPDIVFYTEQWFPCKKQHPFEVSKYALTCFLPYYVPDFGIKNIDCYQQVERMSWVYFCLDHRWKLYYQKSLWWLCHAVKFVATGHPALDYFYKHNCKIPEEGYVIYAPHFSFPWGAGIKTYTIGTFDWSGVAMLEYAEAHPEIKWLFKPHPLLKRELIRSGLMTENEARAYYERWERISEVCLDSDYQELFLSSRVMITDSGSFLPEYGSTGRPVIRMICAVDKIIPPKAAMKVYNSYYQVRNTEEMNTALKLVVEERRDPKQSERLAAVSGAGLCGIDASKNIMNYLLKTLGRGEIKV